MADDTTTVGDDPGHVVNPEPVTVKEVNTLSGTLISGGPGLYAVEPEAGADVELTAEEWDDVVAARPDHKKTATISDEELAAVLAKRAANR